MDQEPDWLVEAIDDPIDTHVVSFSDQIAHDREDLVAQAVEFLAGVDGIREVVHSDRELITITAPGVPTELISQPFAIWWRGAARQAPPWQQSLDHMAAQVHAVTRPAGFKKRKALFKRTTEPGLVHVIELHRILHQGVDRVRPEVGIYVHRADQLLRDHEASPPRWVPESLCQVRGPARSRTAGDEWRIGFELEGGTSAVVERVAGRFLPLLDGIRTIDDLIEMSEQGRTRIGWAGNEPTAIAVLLADRGRTDQAAALFQDQFETATPQQRPRLHELVDRLGLPSPTTGTDPLMSVADEGQLAEWTNREPERLEHLRDLVDRFQVALPAGGARRLLRAARPIRAAHLDLSEPSLDRLWTWLVAVLPRADAMIPQPAPVPNRYRHPRPEMTPAELELAEFIAVYLAAVLRQQYPRHLGVGSNLPPRPASQFVCGSAQHGGPRRRLGKRA